MIRFHNIALISVTPNAPGAISLSVRCISGRAKWVPESHTLSLHADVVDDGVVSEKFTALLSSKQAAFVLEVGCQTGVSPAELSVSRFRHCTQEAFEVRSGTVRPRGPLTIRYFLRAQAEPVAPPNGGSATRLGNSGATEGPPSVS